MRRLRFEELAERSEDFDALVARTPDVDLYCSSSDWILPARSAFAPTAEPLVVSTEEGFIALMTGMTDNLGRTIMPLEAAWGFACPFVSPHPAGLADTLFRLLHRTTLEWDVALLTGIRPGCRLLMQIIRRFQGWYRVGIGPSAKRRVASLEGGYEGFLGRRSAKFRANLRRARRAAERSGVTYEYHRSFATEAQVERFYQRILAIEGQSWKGRLQQGIDREPIETFYRLMIQRLARRGALCGVFATHQGQDMAYVFGGLFERIYRGLQVSYDDRFTRDSPGNLVQAEIIEQLSGEGVLAYDLGSELSYKDRWAEEGLETITCVLFRR